MQRINKIKDEKIQRNMEDEHDLLATRIKRLREKPVLKPVDESVKRVKKPVFPAYAFIEEPVLLVYTFIEEPSKPELIWKPVLIRGKNILILSIMYVAKNFTIRESTNF